MVRRRSDCGADSGRSPPRTSELRPCHPPSSPWDCASTVGFMPIDPSQPGNRKCDSSNWVALNPRTTASLAAASSEISIGPCRAIQGTMG